MGYCVYKDYVYTLCNVKLILSRMYLGACLAVNSSGVNCM